jgi:hypothetical protein
MNSIESYFMSLKRHVNESYKTTTRNIIPIDEKLGTVTSVRQQDRGLSEVDIQRSQQAGRSRFVGQLVVRDIVRHISWRVVAQKVEIARKSTATTTLGYC